MRKRKTERERQREKKRKIKEQGQIIENQENLTHVGQTDGPCELYIFSLLLHNNGHRLTKLNYRVALLTITDDAMLFKIGYLHTKNLIRLI